VFCVEWISIETFEYRRQSFLDLGKWLADCRALASPHLVVVLVGNKLDKEAEREVDYLEGLRWAEENSMLFASHAAIPIKLGHMLYCTADLLFLEISSLTGANAQQPFLLASQSILLLMESGTLDPDESGTGVSFGERQLRAVGSSSRLSLGSAFGRKRKKESVNIKDMVGRGGKCC
jgi:Ras-related protein Rab-4B